MSKERKIRVAKELRETLSQMIPREVSDPRVTKAGLLSINIVELNRDMSVAFIYVSFIGADDKTAEKATEALKGAAGFLRGPVARAMKMKRAPELRFMHDTSVEFREKLSRLNEPSSD